jgi:hypothetical protein
MTIEPQFAELQRCAECGYLAIQRSDGTVVRASRLVRGTGRTDEPNAPFTTAQFICQKQNREFRFGVPPEEILAEINSEYPCEVFTDWHEAKTPKEHEEMSLLEIVREENRIARADDLERMKQWRKEDVTARKLVEFRSWVAIAISVIALLATIASMAFGR